MRNTQCIYISKSSEDIQVQYNMHLQEASTPVDGNEEFVDIQNSGRSTIGV
jgi:hypothetical protein